jgi:hypothetical protein
VKANVVVGARGESEAVGQRLEQRLYATISRSRRRATVRQDGRFRSSLRASCVYDILLKEPGCASWTAFDVRRKRRTRTCSPSRDEFQSGTWYAGAGDRPPLAQRRRELGARRGLPGKTVRGSESPRASGHVAVVRRGRRLALHVSVDTGENWDAQSLQA